MHFTVKSYECIWYLISDYKNKPRLFNKELANFNHVDYLWDDNKAASYGDDQVGLFLYRSNILGADLRITNYSGGQFTIRSNQFDHHKKQ